MLPTSRPPTPSFQQSFASPSDASMSNDVFSDTAEKQRQKDNSSIRRVPSLPSRQRRASTASSPVGRRPAARASTAGTTIQRKRRLSELALKREHVSTRRASAPVQQSAGLRRWPNPNKADKAGRTKLFGSTAAGDLVKVKELVACGAQVNHSDNAGWTPLHEAALKGQQDVARFLIECGAHVNARGFGDDTPLHDACAARSVACVQLLIDAGADVFALNGNKETPLDVCDDDTCASLLRAKMQHLEQLVPQDEHGRTQLHQACADGHHSHAASLLRQGANANARDNDSWTPLHECARTGNTAIARLLVDHGADVNFPGLRGCTALHRASAHGHTELVQFLLDSSANVELCDDAGRTAYDAAATHAETRRILAARLDELRKQRAASDAIDEITFQSHKKQRRHGPEADSAGDDSGRPLSREERKIQAIMRTFATMEQKRRPRPLRHPGADDGSSIALDERRSKRRSRTHSVSSSATTTSRESSVSLEPPQPARKGTADPRRLNPTKKDASGRTFLHKRAGCGDIPAIEALLAAGANPNEQDNAGYTPLHEAALRGHAHAVLLLLQHGADATAKGADDDTPLHDAAANGHAAVVRHLLAFGASPHATNAKGASPVDIATDNGVAEIEHLLRPTGTDGNHNDGDEAGDAKIVHQGTAHDARSASCPRGRQQTQQHATATATETATTTTTTSKGPIPTPPPERRRETCAALLFTVDHWDDRAAKTIPFVVDLQISMMLGMPSTASFWKQYPHVARRPIHADQKLQLWPTFSSILCNQPHHDALAAKRRFIEADLSFVPLEQVLALVKKDHSHMIQQLTARPIDATHRPVDLAATTTAASVFNIVSRRPGCSLPPKFALKLQKLKK